MTKSREFQNKMQPWPDIENLAKTLTIKNKNIDIFYFENGENNSENVILIHGLGDEADTWRHIITHLGQYYHVFALDLPGFGRSSKPDYDYSPEFFKETILDFMDSLNIGNTFLIGSSLGGILAQGFAVDYPEKVKGLVLVGGALYQHGSIQDKGLKLMRIPLLGEWLYTRLRKDPDAAYESLSNVYYQLDKLSKPDRDFLYQRVNQRVWSSEQRRAYFSTLRNLTKWVNKSQPDLKEKLKALQLPVLVIRGEYDALYSDENADLLVNSQSNAAKVIINDSGHLPHQETPAVFNKAVTLWLSDRVQSS